MRRTPLLLVPLVLASACADLPSAPAEFTSSRASADVVAPGITVVMSGLNSPRGLDFAPNGDLYVAEAGTAQVTGACITVMEGPNLVPKCYSGTGSVSRLRKGVQERIVSGLASSVLVLSGFAAGPQDVSFGGGSAWVVVGAGNHPDQRGDLGADYAAVAGKLLQLQPSGQWRVTADVSAFELGNPAGGPIDSNPFGVLAESGRRFITDAGGNTLLQVAANGKIDLVATFPSTASPPPFPPAEPVPTRVVRGPDGALYVSTLSGAPFVAGAAAVYRVVPGSAPVLYEGGFKMITDLAFGADGSLYVLQFATAPLFPGGPGALIRVAPDGTRTTITTSLEQPTGLTVGPDGSLYVSNRGTSSGNGEVLKIRL